MTKDDEIRIPCRIEPPTEQGRDWLIRIETRVYAGEIRVMHRSIIEERFMERLRAGCDIIIRPSEGRDFYIPPVTDEPNDKP